MTRIWVIILIPLIMLVAFTSTSAHDGGRNNLKQSPTFQGEQLDTEGNTIKRNQQWEADADIENVEDQEDTPERLRALRHNNTLLPHVDDNKKHFVSKLNTNNKQFNITSRRLIALKPFLQKEVNSKKRRTRRSLYGFQEWRENEADIVNNENTFITSDRAQDVIDEERRMRRSSDLGNAIKRAKLVQLNLSELKNNQLNPVSKKPSRRTLNTPPTRSTKIQKYKIETINSKKPASSALSRSGTKQQQNIVSASEDQKRKKILQSTFFANNQKSLRHIVPQRSTITKPSSQAIASKSSRTDNPVVSSTEKENNPVERQHISHPKDKESSAINTANVARAVAVAMEQLKRDQMWGKVFVHVRPSGELKVMVQETRKMEDESM